MSELLRTPTAAPTDSALVVAQPKHSQCRHAIPSLPAEGRQ